MIRIALFNLFGKDNINNINKDKSKKSFAVVDLYFSHMGFETKYLKKYEFQKSYHIDNSKEYLAGRSNNADIPIDRIYVSRKQGKFFFRSGSLIYKHLSKKRESILFRGSDSSLIIDEEPLEQGDMIVYIFPNSPSRVILLIKRIKK